MKCFWKWYHHSKIGQLPRVHQLPGRIERRVESRRVVFLRCNKRRGGEQEVKMTACFYKWYDSSKIEQIPQTDHFQGRIECCYVGLGLARGAFACIYIYSNYVYTYRLLAAWPVYYPPYASLHPTTVLKDTGHSTVFGRPRALARDRHREPPAGRGVTSRPASLL